MSAPSNCCSPCSSDAEIVNVPGVEGEPGEDGAPGTDEENAYTVLTNTFLIPPVGDNVSSVKVASSDWMAIGQPVFIPNAGVFIVLDIVDSTTISLTYPAYSANVNSGSTTGLFIVTPSGFQVGVSGITDFTDNSGGTPSSTIAAGVGVTTLTFYYEAPSILNGDLLTNYVPGYAFKILKVDARCSKPVTTVAKAASINLEIGTTDLTGGVVALAGAYIIGAAQAGTAVSGANTGTSTDSFSIEASGVTAFIEGAFVILVEIANLDTQNAFASVATKTNAILAALDV